MNSIMAPPANSNQIFQFIFSALALKQDMVRVQKVPATTRRVLAFPSVPLKNGQ